jgi:hypothetical protein
MSPFTALQSVQVINPDHPRVNQAGAVIDIEPDQDNNIVVRFDVDLAEEKIAVTDIHAL